MSQVNYQQVRSTYLKATQKHIELSTDSTRCHLPLILDLLGLGAVNGESVSSACENTRGAPTSAAVLYQLREGWLKDIAWDDLVTQLNEWLVAQLPDGVCGRQHEVAIDLTYIPYHGEAYQNEDEIRRSAAKSGTTHFHVYASAYIVRNNKRVTVAVLPYQADENLFDVLLTLLSRLEQLDIGIKRLLLDRQFSTVEVLSYLQGQDWQSILPVSARSQTLRTVQEQAQKSDVRSYTMTSGEGHTVTFPLHVVCRYAQGRRGKQGIDVLLFAVVGEPWTSTPHQLAEVFSRRFGIESSYTLMNALRIRTTSRDPKLRLLFVVLSFFLINLWIYFQWTFLAIPRRGGRLLDPSLLRLSRFRTFLRCAIRAVRPPVLIVRRPSSPVF